MIEEKEADTTAKTKLTPEQQSAVLYWPTIANIPIIPCDYYSHLLVYIRTAILGVYWELIK
jgi:hypothetical protein